VGTRIAIPDRASPIAAEPRPPTIAHLLPFAVRALEQEGRPSPNGLAVVSAQSRTWSTTWELAAGDERYILKWLPRRAARERELARLTQRVFTSDPTVRTPCVACNPTPDTFLVEKLPGRPLHAVCTQPPLFGTSQWIESRRAILQRVGRWLRAFHLAGQQPGPGRLEGVRAYALNRQDALEALERDLVEEFWRRLDRSVTHVRVRVHGDFTPHNILVADTSISVIDMAGINELEWDTPAFDAAAMVVGLQENWRRRRRNHLRFFSAPINRMIQAFLSAAGLREKDDALPLCYAVRHLQRIHNRRRVTGRLPGRSNWHVRQVRLALERPELIHQLGCDV
jgi:aminoglycoside phosphotransferase (APT) family kinase protein